MIQFANVLCPVDLSEGAAHALSHATSLARWYDARLTVLHVVPTFDPILVRPTHLDGTVQVVQPPLQYDVIEELRRAVEAAGPAPAHVALASEAGDPAAAIVDRAVSLPADLVVMGTHGRGGFERMLLGSVAEKVLRRAPCPVMTVPPRAAAELPAEVRFRQILCPMDFSASALQAFGYALDLARQADGTVTLLHVVEWLPEDEPPAYAHFSVPEFRRQLVEDARARLDQLIAGESQTWAAIRSTVAMGRSHREILRVAAEAEPADLIVMGAQGRGGLGLALFGSTTQQVVRGAACPVLTVRVEKPAQTS